MHELPTGTVTLLFTDIAGSTRVLEQLGEGYADALAEHRRLLRATFDRHGGVEVDTQGDAFFVAFGKASDALAAATEAQAALAAAGPIRGRIGMHTLVSGTRASGAALAVPASLRSVPADIHTAPPTPVRLACVEE